MKVFICKLNRAFDQWCWLCESCQEAKKRDGYSVERREVVSAEFCCDSCGRGEQKSRAEGNYNLEPASHGCSKGT